MSWAASPPAQAGGSALRRTARSASGVASLAGAAVIWVALLGPVITLLTHLSWSQVSAALSVPGALDPLLTSVESDRKSVV